MTNHRKTLCSTFPGDAQRMRALLAYLGATGDASVLLSVLDDAEAAGVNGANELADAIRRAAGIHHVGVR
jgi:hypothetical protein